MAARLTAKGVPASRLHVLPNWADLDNIRPAERHNLIRRELGLTSETIVLRRQPGGKTGSGGGPRPQITRENSPSATMAGEVRGPARLMAGPKLGLDNLIFLPLQSTSRFPLLLAAADSIWWCSGKRPRI
jgi:colanic acid biosynthesis glycosyl transferase WcaI